MWSWWAADLVSCSVLWLVEVVLLVWIFCLLFVRVPPGVR